MNFKVDSTTPFGWSLRLCVFGGLCGDWYTNGHFCCLTVFDCFWLLLLLVVAVVGTNSVPIVKNSQKTVKTAKMTIGVPIVTESAEYTKSASASASAVRVCRIHKAVITRLIDHFAFSVLQHLGKYSRPILCILHYCKIS